jgi:hypothetical protein
MQPENCAGDLTICYNQTFADSSGSLGRADWILGWYNLPCLNPSQQTNLCIAEQMGEQIMRNNLVLHFADGTIRKGTTDDFFPNKDLFHFAENVSGEVDEIRVGTLKAIYFVKSFEGNPAYKENADMERVGFGKKICVHFKDGEIQLGYTQGYAPNRPGFFVFPCDPDSNNDRIFIVSTATTKVNFI